MESYRILPRRAKALSHEKESPHEMCGLMEIGLENFWNVLSCSPTSNTNGGAFVVLKITTTSIFLGLPS